MDLQSEGQTGHNGRLNHGRRVAGFVLLLVLAFMFWNGCSHKSTSPPPPSHAAFHLPAAAHHAAGGPDLTGQVTIKGGGPPPGPATVYIATATPRKGVSIVGASDYDDCAKHVQTDAEGAFKIPALDPALTFQVIAVADGYQPKTVNKADPAKGKPVKIELEPVVAADAPPGQTLSGRVLDPQGKPIAGALVEVSGLESKDGGGRYGGYAGIDREALTGADGTFLITDKTPFDMMLVTVTARSYADKKFDRLTSGTPHDLVMTEGAGLHGRVLLNDQPLAGVSVGISAVNQGMGAFLGHFEVGTDKEGNFDFIHVPPDGDYNIYTLMSSMKNKGAVPPGRVHIGADGETTEAGDLVVGPAHILAGRVVLADDQPVPAKTLLYVGSDTDWDSQRITLGKDGGFNVPGIPPEIITLSVRIKGYHTSSRNVSVDQMNPFRLIGRVDHDITNLVVLLENGPETPPDYQHYDPDFQEMRNRPLTGAEGGVDHSQDWTVSGHVYDRDTKSPVRNFRVTPGQTDDYNRTGWKTLYAVDGTNGAYETYFSKRAAQPLIKVEAQGYLPASLPLQSQDCTNVDFLLAKGSGPSGAVVTDDGSPAAGATVVLLTDEFNQAGLNGASGLTTYGNRSGAQTADEHGYFAFQPVLGMSSLAASSSNGFAEISLADFAAHKTIRLSPYGKITGTLKRTSGPGTNETLDVQFAEGGPGPINLSVTATTDAQGGFEFDHVPAGSLRISYRLMMPQGNGWQNESLQEVDLKPGQTLAVDITAPDRSAAESAVNNRRYQPPPEPKRLPGVNLKGVILEPDGQPAADADVALQVENKYLTIGRGAFGDYNLRNEGLIVSTGPDGSFTLPLYEGAESVIALNVQGFAQVSLDQLKASPRITLQKWGRIEGTLRVNHHPGTNEVVGLNSARAWWGAPHRPGSGSTNAPAELPLMYNPSAFEAKTDAQGRFLITFVPPGEQVIHRRIPLGAGSWTQSTLAQVDVAAGDTLVTNLGGSGRTVIGTLKFSGEAPFSFKRAFARITPPTSQYLEKLNAAKTDAEREALSESLAAENAKRMYQNYAATVQPDGSFRAEDVQPGTYEFGIQPLMTGIPADGEMKLYGSVHELVVPAAKDENDDSVVDWGGIEMTNRSIQMPTAAAGTNASRVKL